MSDTPRDCKHGRLARSCEICELERELAAATREASIVMRSLTKHFPPNPNWKLDTTLVGIILQISNATTAWCECEKDRDQLQRELAEAKKQLCEIKCELALSTEHDDEKPIVTIRRLSSKLTKANSDGENLHAKTRELESRYDVLERELLRQQSLVRLKCDDIAKANERVERHEAQIHKLADWILAQDAGYPKEGGACETAIQWITELRQQLDATDRELIETRKDNNTLMEHCGHLSHLKLELYNAIGELAVDRKEKVRGFDFLENQVRELQAEVERLQATLDLNCEELGRVRAQRDECRELLAKSTSDGENLHAKMRELEAENERLQLEVAVGEKLRERLREQDRTIERLQRGWDGATEISNRMELERNEWRDDRQANNAKLYEENKALKAEVERLRVSTIPATNGYWYEQHEVQRKLAVELALDRDRWRENSEGLAKAGKNVVTCRSDIEGTSSTRIYMAELQDLVDALAAHEQLKGTKP